MKAEKTVKISKQKMMQICRICKGTIMEIKSASPFHFIPATIIRDVFPFCFSLKAYIILYLFLYVL